MPEKRVVRVLRPDPQSGGMAVISVCVPETIPLFRVGHDGSTDLRTEVRAYAVGSVRPLGAFASVGNSTLQPDEFLLIQRDSGPPLVAGDPPFPGAGRRRVGSKPARWSSTAWQTLRTWCATTPPGIPWALPAASSVLLICALGAWAGAVLAPEPPDQPAAHTTAAPKKGTLHEPDRFRGDSVAVAGRETDETGGSDVRESEENLRRADTREFPEHSDARALQPGISAEPESAGAPARRDSAWGPQEEDQSAGPAVGAPDEDTPAMGLGVDRALQPGSSPGGTAGEDFRPDWEQGSPHDATPAEEPDPRRARPPRFSSPMANPAWEAYAAERSGDQERAEAGYLLTWNRALRAGRGYGALKVWALQGLVRTGRRLGNDYSARMAVQQLTALRQAFRYSGRRKEK